MKMFAEKITGVIKGTATSGTSILAADFSVVGNITSDGVLEIEGKVDGDIIGNIVTLRENSRVNGIINSKVLNIKGKFKGTIKSEKVNISGKANVEGNIEYSTLSVEDGSSICGDLKRVDFKSSLPPDTSTPREPRINLAQESRVKEIKEMKESAK